jgi:hypothetical protein
MMLDHKGAVILLNAQSGEVLVMASHPTFNPNHLDEVGAQLGKDPNKPLINRAVQGLYPVGDFLEPFAAAMQQDQPVTQGELQAMANAFGFTRAPQLPMQVAEPLPLSLTRATDFHISPLQAALAAAALSNNGIIPAPRIAVAVNTPEQGWVVLPALGSPIEAIPASDASEAALSFVQQGQSYWSHIGQADGDESDVTWFVAGTPPNWQATPLVVVVVLEKDNARLAEQIGRELLIDAMNP